jgi:hypothetical protein
MAHTATSKILSFLLEKTITNTQHYRSQQLLQLQVVHHYNQLVCTCDGMGFSSLGYCLERFSDWHSFVMLHVMAVLGPALDPRFYPSHRDYGIASEYDCVMLAYGRGAALRTMSFINRSNIIKLNLPGSRTLVDPITYFQDVLLDQAVYLVQAFDTTQAEETPEFSDLTKDDRPHLLRMLREALKHCPRLVVDFNTWVERVRLSTVEASPLTIPLAPEGGRIVNVEQTRAGGRRRVQHNPEAVIRYGLTPTLHPILRRYHEEVVIKKEMEKDRELQC